MYYPVPYIPSPHVPAGDWRRGEHCCHVWMVLRITLRQVSNSRAEVTEVCMILWRGVGRPHAWTVLHWTSPTAAAAPSTLLKWACTEKAGSTWKPKSIETVPLRSLTQGHFQTAVIEVYLVMRKLIHFCLYPMCFCRRVKIKLMELNSLRELQKQTGGEAPRATKKSCLYYFQGNHFALGFKKHLF